MKPAPSMAVLLLALLAGGASAARLPGGSSREMLATQSQSQQFTTFPFSQCTGGFNNINNSPYRLDVVGRASSRDMEGMVTESVTFQLVHFGLTDYDLEEDNVCYDALMGDLHTIGFRSEDACDGPIMATVNGASVHGKWQHTLYGSVIKFSNLKLKNADGILITVELPGLCNSMELFFGSQVEYTLMNKGQKCCPTSSLDFLPEAAHHRKLSATYTTSKPPSPRAPKAPKYPAFPRAPKAPVPRYLLEEAHDRKLSATYTTAKPPSPRAPKAPKYPASPRAPKNPAY